MLSNLFKKDSSTLFDQATAIAKPLNNVLCSPIPLTTECEMNPPCRHCWWKSMSYFNSDFCRRRDPDEIAARVEELFYNGLKLII
jgi:hypothetical protein